MATGNVRPQHHLAERQQMLDRVRLLQVRLDDAAKQLGHVESVMQLAQTVFGNRDVGYKGDLARTELEELGALRQIKGELERKSQIMSLNSATRYERKLLNAELKSVQCSLHCVELLGLGRQLNTIINWLQQDDAGRFRVDLSDIVSIQSRINEFLARANLENLQVPVLQFRVATNVSEEVTRVGSLGVGLFSPVGHNKVTQAPKSAHSGACRYASPGR